MDISKEYEMMCEKALYVQAEWKPRRGDRVVMGRPDGQSVIRFAHEEEADAMLLAKLGAKKLNEGHSFFWVPRQDQLIHLVWDKFDGWKDLINCAAKWDSYKGKWSLLDTGEKFWLAFVMAMNHDAIWNGTKWEEKPPAPISK